MHFKHSISPDRLTNAAFSHNHKAKSPRNLPMCYQLQRYMEMSRTSQWLPFMSFSDIKVAYSASVRQDIVLVLTLTNVSSIQ